MPKPNRLDHLRAEMAHHGLEALLVSAPSNVMWLTGFRGTASSVLVSPAGLDLVVYFRYWEQAATEAPAAQRIMVEGTRYDVAIAHAVKIAGVKRLAFEADHVTVAEHMALTSALPGVKLVPSRGLVEVGRAIKDAKEIAAVRKAAAITSASVAEAMRAACPGMTERALANAIEAAMRARGAEGLAFPVLVASGPRAALPHPRPSDRRLQAGDWLMIDAGAMVDGYRADMTRTLVVGAPSDAQRAAWDAVHAALQAGLAAIRPGALAGDVDEACRQVLASRGYDRLFGHDSGHGVGLDLHEAPSLGRGSDELLAPGMIVTVEPGLYLPGVGGVRLEELALVGPKGAEVLTTAPLGIDALPSQIRSW